MADRKGSIVASPAAPVLWELTCESDTGHRTVFRVSAVTEADARKRLPDDAPDNIVSVVQVPR
jgi:hypothetical protein